MYLLAACSEYILLPELIAASMHSPVHIFSSTARRSFVLGCWLHSLVYCTHAYPKKGGCKGLDKDVRTRRDFGNGSGEDERNSRGVHWDRNNGCCNHGTSLLY